MGVDMNELDKAEMITYKQAVKDMGTAVVHRMTSGLFMDWMVHPLISTYGQLQNKALEILLRFSKQLIKTRLEYHRCHDSKLLNVFCTMEDDNGYLVDQVYAGQNVKLSMLDLLLSMELAGRIDKEGIQEEVDNFVFAGHETTGMTLTFLLMLLAENPKHQEKVRQEVNEVILSGGNKLTVHELKKLKYLDRCIKETLRLYPAVPTISRQLEKDMQLTKYILPAGTDVYIFIYDVHRNPDFWPEPENFDPDRFLSEKIKNRHPFSYIPFSAGPRNCIGQKFAINELKSLTAKILHNFQLKPITRSCEIKYNFNLTIKPNHPIYVEFKKIVTR